MSILSLLEVIESLILCVQTVALITLTEVKRMTSGKLYQPSLKRLYSRNTEEVISPGLLSFHFSVSV